MREIEFRGKLKSGWYKGRKNKKWVYGYLSSPDCIRIKEVDGVIVTYEPYFIIPETVGQYIELKDKDGVKIFDGDIVKADLDLGREPDDRVCMTMDVIFYKGKFCLRRYHKNVDPLYDVCPISDFHNIFVIGNIYDNPNNPDLLGGK